MTPETKEAPPVRQPPPTCSVRRVNRFLSTFENSQYLEVGVSTGRTFFDVVADRKVAVDPRFKFDVKKHEKEGVEFHSITSDAYFDALPIGNKFDVVFLDGLHTFEQTYRDLLNTLVHTHDGSVILIDDTVPSDVYSAMPDHVRSRQFRQRDGSTRNGWHGDTYKVVFAIHDFAPSLCYRTLLGRGNFQTLVWRGKSQPRTPIFDNLEKISRLSYFDMFEHDHVFQRLDEAAAFEECLAALGKGAPPG